MRKVVFRDGITTACEKTGGPATAPAGGAFTVVRTAVCRDDATNAGSRL